VRPINIDTLDEDKIDAILPLAGSLAALVILLGILVI
jgi:hypothetical protein